jgi:hypothetical protein
MIVSASMTNTMRYWLYRILIFTLRYFGIPTSIVIGVLTTIAALRRKYGQWIFSVLVDYYTCTMNAALIKNLREKFVVSEPKVYRSTVVNHAHPFEADKRCQATTTITDFINFHNGTSDVKYRRYDVSTSRRENKWKVEGTRLVYGDRDLGTGTATRDDKLCPDHIVSMVDVDYYLDNFSKYAMNPMMLYTCIPNHLAGVLNDGSTEYRHVSPGVYEERITGGAVYTSKLWDYSNDLVRIQRSWFGLIPRDFSICKIEILRQPNTECRAFVSIIPVVRSYLPYWLHRAIAYITGAEYTYGSVNEIQPAQNVDEKPGYVYGTFYDQKKHRFNVEVMHKDQLTAECVSIPETVMRVLVDYHDQHGDKTALGDVSGILTRANINIDGSGPYVLHTFLRGTRPDLNKLRVNYQMIPTGTLRKFNKYEDGKPTAKILCDPLVMAEDVAVAPVAGKTNDTACIVGRVDKVANNVELDDELSAIAEEFADLCARPLMAGKTPQDNELPRGKLGTGHPWTLEEVDAQQTLANQKLRTDRAKRHTPDDAGKVQSFQKSEAYVKVSDPRNISTVKTDHTRQLSQYTYAFAKHLKTVFGPESIGAGKFYYPGCTPWIIATGIFTYVSGLFSKLFNLVETDYSRFDGTISASLRQKVEFACLLKFFNRRHTRHLTKLLQNELKQQAKTKYGVRYNTGGSRLSGSPLTTIGNTLINAFVVYAAWRLKGKTPVEAMRLIGPKYGDDGLDAAGADYMIVATRMGLKLKLDDVDLTQTGRVSFLSRIYPDARHYNWSHFDVKKALCKLPVVCNGVRSAIDSLHCKLTGYLSMDPETPVLSSYIRATMRAHGLDEERVFDALTAEEKFMSTLRSAWPIPTLGDNDTHDVIAESVALNLAMTCADVNTLDASLHFAHTRQMICDLQFKHRLTAEDRYQMEGVMFYDE